MLRSRGAELRGGWVSKRSMGFLLRCLRSTDVDFVYGSDLGFVWEVLFWYGLAESTSSCGVVAISVDLELAFRVIMMRWTRGVR